MTSTRLARPYALVAWAALLFAGCSRNEAWFPLQQGREWKYLVRQSGGVMTVRVIEQVRVGHEQGWLLDGEGGQSKLTWVSGELQASLLTATSFKPSIILLKPGDESATWGWSGVSISRAKPAKSTATFVQSSDKVSFGGVERKTLKVVMKMRRGDTDIELTTWYERGTGVLQQEQRNNDELVASLVLTGER